MRPSPDAVGSPAATHNLRFLAERLYLGQSAMLPASADTPRSPATRVDAPADPIPRCPIPQLGSYEQGALACAISIQGSLEILPVRLLSLRITRRILSDPAF